MGNLKSSYYLKVGTSFPIEKRYSPFGIYAVSDITYEKLTNIDRINTIKVFYPNEMIFFPEKKYPLIIMVNGNDQGYEKIEVTGKHLSSWGFIVVCNDDGSTGQGFSIIKTIEYMLNLNKTESNMFFNKIDIEKIGIYGNSQGGCGIINAITKFGTQSELIKCAFVGSTATKTCLEQFKLESCNYDTSLIKIPIMMVTGTGNAESHVCPFNESKENFDKITNVKKVFARRKNADHNEMFVAQDPYMTAWFWFHFKDDQEAGKAFCGSEPELKKNEENWQDVVIENFN